MMHVSFLILAFFQLPAGAETRQNAPSNSSGLNMAPCRDQDLQTLPPAMRYPYCFFDGQGNLHHWAVEAQSQDPLVTGGYPVVSALQQKYSDWRRRYPDDAWIIPNDPNEAYNVRGHPWGNLLSLRPVIPVTGMFTCQTLKIPYYFLDGQVDDLWEAFCEDFKRTDPDGRSDICDGGGQHRMPDQKSWGGGRLGYVDASFVEEPAVSDYKVQCSPSQKGLDMDCAIRSKEGWPQGGYLIYGYPNDDLKTRAFAIIAARRKAAILAQRIDHSGLAACSKIGREQSSIYYSRDDGSDAHLEPQQLSDSFIGFVGDAQDEAREAIEVAQRLADEYKAKFLEQP